MIATSCPGLYGTGGRRGHVGVDVTDRDRDPFGESGPLRCLGGQVTGTVTRAGDRLVELSVTKPEKAGLSAARKSARVGAVL